MSGTAGDPAPATIYAAGVSSRIALPACQVNPAGPLCYHRLAVAERAYKRTFSYEEALNTFPQVRDLTHAAVRRVEALLNRVRSRDEMESRKEELEGAYGRILQAWAEEVTSLGCEVKGLWLVDWDSGDGYYCWRYPEETIGHFHTYEDGFAGRMPIA